MIMASQSIPPNATPPRNSRPYDQGLLVSLHNKAGEKKTLFPEGGTLGWGQVELLESRPQNDTKNQS